MSDTPRTEAEVNRQKCWSDDLITIDANFACQLERELNAAAKERDDALIMLGLYRMISGEQKTRIKRLEEAGDAMERWCSDAVSADNWRKAKEAKP